MLNRRAEDTKRFDRRAFMTALAATPLLTLPVAQSGAAQTPVADRISGWESWADVITPAPAGPLRWRSLRYKASPIEEAPFTNHPLGFVWNIDGRATLAVRNDTQGSTRELDDSAGPRAVSFNRDQDSEARGLADPDNAPWPYRYENFTLVPAETYMSKEEGAEIWGWTDRFTLTDPELRLSFGSLTFTTRDVVTWEANDPDQSHPFFAMCVEGRIATLDDDWDAGLELKPGDFIELSPDSPVAMLYGRSVTNVLVGVHAPDAGQIRIEPMES